MSLAVALASYPDLHISASAIRTSQDCRRAFFYRYLAGAPKESVSSAQVLGSAVHKSLRLFYEALRDECGELDLDDLVRVSALSISKAIVGDVPVLYKYGETPEGLVAEAEALLTTFLESGYRPVKVLDVESRFVIPMVHPETGEVALEFEENLLGFFDLVAVDADGNAQVIDHKVCARRSPPKATVDDVQASVYAYAGDQLFGENVRMFHQLVVRGKQPRVELVEIPRSHRDGAEAIETAWAAIDLIHCALRHPRPLRLMGRTRSWRCRGCPYERRCEQEAV